MTERAGADIEAISLPPTSWMSSPPQSSGSGVTDWRCVLPGVDEDLPDASYAGQYETVLNVPTRELATAVRRCWASSFSDQVKAYRRGRGSASTVGMAVLIQPMVEADAAGVAFSADPMTSDPNAAVVNAVRGLGDRLVSGLASPDDWLVSGTQAISVHARRRNQRRGGRRGGPARAARRRPPARSAGHRVGSGGQRGRTASGAADHGSSRTNRSGRCRFRSTMRPGYWEREAVRCPEASVTNERLRRLGRSRQPRDSTGVLRAGSARRGR